MEQNLLDAGLAELRAGLLDNALRRFQQALATTPNRAEAMVFLGNCHASLSQDALALHCFRRSRTLAPHLFDAYFNESNLLQSRGRLSEAEVMLDRASVIDPASHQAATNRASLRRLLGHDIREISKGYRRSLAIKPSRNHRAAVNLGQMLLSLGEFREGWETFQSRFSVETPGLKTSLPAYAGEKSDQQVLVWGEQGVGDQIMFISMIPDLLTRCGHVTARVDGRLVNIFQRSFPDVGFENDDVDLNDDDFDVQVSLGDLGMFFRQSIEDFPKTPGYLKVDDSRRATFIHRLQDLSANMKVGISWRSINKDTGAARTIDAATMVRYLSADGVTLINLQYDSTDEELAMIPGSSVAGGSVLVTLPELDRYNDIDGVASLSAACDLVISIGNTTAHVAAATGKETWALIPKPAAWRWMAEGTTTPWYPNVRLFRQQTQGEWEQILADIREKLAALAVSRRT